MNLAFPKDAETTLSIAQKRSPVRGPSFALRGRALASPPPALPMAPAPPVPRPPVETPPAVRSGRCKGPECCLDPHLGCPEIILPVLLHVEIFSEETSVVHVALWGSYIDFDNPELLLSVRFLPTGTYRNVQRAWVLVPPHPPLIGGGGPGKCRYALLRSPLPFAPWKTGAALMSTLMPEAHQWDPEHM